MSGNLNSFTEVTNTSWFSRIGSSFKGILFGIILIVIAVGVLFYNEGKAVKTAKGLKEGLSAVISVDAQQQDASRQGKLIHISGEVLTQDMLKDDDFGIIVNALKLKRNVQMYQWSENQQSETKTKLGGGEETVTTYSYEKKWSQQLENSSSFKNPEGHQNPNSFKYNAYSKSASNASLGVYKLSNSIVSKISNFTSLRIDAIDTLKVKNAHLSGNQIYIGEGNLQEPNIGDLKVSFSVVKPGRDYSIVSKEMNGNLVPYLTKTGTNIELVSKGIISASSMFESAQKQNTFLTWLFRIIGFFMMYFGFLLILRPLEVFADVVPFIGNIVGFGLKILSFLLGLALWFITIAIGWIFYRPVVGTALLVLVAVLIVSIVVLVGRKKDKSSAVSA